jgi:hypothetical protein
MRTRTLNALSVGAILVPFAVLIYTGSPKLHHPYLGVFDGKHTVGVPGGQIIQMNVSGQPFNVRYVTRATPQGVRTKSHAFFGNRGPLVIDVPTTPETMALMVGTATN